MAANSPSSQPSGINKKVSDSPPDAKKMNVYSWLTQRYASWRKTREQRNVIIQRHRLLQIEISNILVGNPDAQIHKKLSQLSDLEQVIEIQSKWTDALKYVAALVALFLSVLWGIPGFSTPGYIDVQTKVVEFILTEDYEWSGNIQIPPQSPIQLSNFEYIYSPNIPELSIQESKQVLWVNTQDKAVLESLSIPAGSRVRAEWVSAKRSFLISVSPANSNINPELIVRAEYLLSGTSYFESEGLQGTVSIQRPAMPCEFEDNCLTSRSLIVTSPLHAMPKFSMTTASEIDLYGFEVNQFLFSKFTAQNSLHRRNRCMILSGEYWLRGADNATPLHRGECVKVDSNGGALSIQVAGASHAEPTMSVWYQGEVDKLNVGTPEFATNKSPQIFAWLVAHPDIKIIISIISALLATGLVIIRIRK